MIGNDIIDIKLATTQSNWKRKGWLQKIFTDKERELIAFSDFPNSMVWKLWSMKEASYKAHQRRFELPRKINPLDFECVDSNVVKIDSFQYHTSSSIDHDYIYTEAFPGEISMITSKVFRGNKNKAKEELKHFMQHTYKLQSRELTIKNNKEGVPQFLMDAKRTLKFNFSLTHHGRFSAFVITSKY